MRGVLTAAALIAVLSPALAQVPAKKAAKAPAPNPMEQEGRAAVLATLKDPGSAQFQKVSVRQATNKRGEPFPVVCGEVNAKNSFGGYIGFAPWVYLADMKQVHMLGPDRNIVTVSLLSDYCS